MTDERFDSDSGQMAEEGPVHEQGSSERAFVVSELADRAGVDACGEAAQADEASSCATHVVSPLSLTVDELAALLPFPREDANKYTRGMLTLVAGSERYPGAACLAAFAAQRMGAGYVRAIVPASVRSVLLAAHPSVVAVARKDWDASDIGVVKAGHPQAVCAGPGFDAYDEETPKLVGAILRQASCPVLLDGGALRYLASKRARKLLKRRFVRGLPTVITPHGGEAAVLARPFAFSTDDPAQLASRLSLAYGAIVVLKGPQTFISDGERTYAVTDGTADLAKAGTGDVLAGMIGALLAQGLDPMQASVLGATLHGCAGRLAGGRYTSIGVRAEDVCDFVPAAIQDVAGKRTEGNVIKENV